MPELGSRPPREPLLDVKGVKVKYGAIEALRGVSLRYRKSTRLNTIH